MFGRRLPAFGGRIEELGEGDVTRLEPRRGGAGLQNA